jgi:lysophospholipase L1-like esterase
MIERLGAAVAAVLLFSSPALAQTGGQAGAPPPAHAAVRVVLVGDSTMQAGTGYGGALCARFAPEVACVNRGLGGRSTKSYRAEGSWDKVLDLVRDGGADTTWMFIQLGHNDFSPKPERHTELAEYKANMTRFVDEARAAGATPVLITPVTDRRFVDGKLLPGMQPWAQLTAEVAREGSVPLIDLYGESYDAVQAMGALKAAWIPPGQPPASVLEAAKTGNTPGVLAPPPEPPLAPGAAPPTPAVAPDGLPRRGPFDYVHIGPAAATLFAGMVADQVKAKIIPLSPYVVAAK